MSAYPRGAFNSHWFNLFNAVAFQVMMGAPIVLFAKSLGASSTVIGIIAAFTPLMTVMQLPAARFLDRYSYRQFVLNGWGLRTFFIFIVAIVPLLGFLDNTSKLAVLLATLFIFNLLRGISSAGWMPWIAAIIPEPVRGRFLARDQLFTFTGSLLALVASAFVMNGRVVPWEFSLVFLLSALGGTASLWFIQRIPDAPCGDTMSRSAHPVPWLAMLAHPPFLRLLGFNVLFMTVIGSLGVFTIEYLREYQKFEANLVLMLSGVAFVGPILSLMLTARIIDGVGSKPILRAALATFALVLLGWLLIAGGVLPCSVPIVMTLNFFTGLAAANFNVANLRITMATMPEMGRNHFFALFTVITSLGLGAAPVMWGVTLDAIGSYELVTGWFAWRRHSIYFAVLLALDLVALFAISKLVERADLREPAEAAFADAMRKNIS
ncbi:MAG: MFS transporter [Terrimicrobiaceae bacterium]|nr:MFS transporter [Terrimicrobiaceae bacterium]